MCEELNEELQAAGQLSMPAAAQKLNLPAQFLIEVRLHQLCYLAFSLSLIAGLLIRITCL